MKRHHIPREEVERIAAQAGIKMAAPDHPVYREGPSIVFVSRTRKQSGPKVVDSPYSSSVSEADPMRPAIDAVERWLKERTEGMSTEPAEPGPSPQPPGTSAKNDAED